MTGETTGAGRAAALADLEAASRIRARTGVKISVPIPGRSLADRAANRDALEVLSRIAARGAHSKALGGAQDHLPARAAFEAVVALQESIKTGAVQADAEQQQVLGDGYRVVATLAIQEALERRSPH